MGCEVTDGFRLWSERDVKWPISATTLDKITESDNISHHYMVLIHSTTITFRTIIIDIYDYYYYVITGYF